MKNGLIIFSIILLILFWGFVYFYFFDSGINSEGFFDKFGKDFFSSDKSGEEGDNVNTGGSSSVGSDSLSSESSLGSEGVEETVLPSDLYDVECGFYFDEYNVCGGVCPTGSCVSEGRSCYCKI